MMTLRISTILALAASLSAGFASTLLGQFYTELLRGAPLPALTDLILWHYGILYWIGIPAVVIALFMLGKRKEAKRQSFAEGIMITSTASTILFMIGAFLPMTTITVYLKE